MVLRVRPGSSVKPLCPTLHFISLKGKELPRGDLPLALAQDWVVTSHRLVWLPGLWETPFLFINFSTVLGWMIGLTGWRL